MVDETPPVLDRVFYALSNSTRRAMLCQLTDGQRSVGDLAAPHAMSLAGAAKHVRVLEEAGLVARQVRGRVHLVRLQPQALQQANQWLAFYTRFWNEQLDALETLFAEED
ncbi:MAG: winged helix-turn-helix transcriptional regulator [Anaerolineales bacterium]|nr:winged helix-turn-helix transcriptional regulator [Anaerolineales bacterium]MCW5855554.1 winged helix-turn-helix transcriptional regulator [Anaerolineales bacterium]